MQIEVNLRRGAAAEERWGSDPNYRAEIKREIAKAMARVLRVQDLIEWKTEALPSGDFLVRGFLRAEAGTPEAVEHVVELNPVSA